MAVGEPQAEFAAWVRPSLRPMDLLARRLSSDADAEDVVQEALLRAWRKRHTYDQERGSVASWLLAITANIARRRFHQLQRRPSPVPVEDVPDWRDEDTHVTGIDIERAVARLPTKQRMAVELHYFVGLTVTETAEVLGIQPGTVKSHLYDARARMRDWLEPTS